VGIKPGNVLKVCVMQTKQRRLDALSLLQTKTQHYLPSGAQRQNPEPTGYPHL